MDFGLAYLGVGYALAFLGVLAYLLSIAKRQRALEKRIDEIANTTDRSQGRGA